MKKQISGWGNNISVKTNVTYPNNLLQLQQNLKNNCVARGLGRSYGDSSINKKKTIITTNLNKIILFDKTNGILEAESGASIEQILEIIVKEGWFLPVTPGSKQITLGGMIASNVHGKNHHKVGNFSNFILGLKVVNHKKKIIECSKKKNNSLFKYTIGGMGLTGIIYSCKIKLRKIKSDVIYEEKIKNYNLKETLKSINASKNWEFNVAWIDTSSNIKVLGRSILTRGYFLKKRKREFFFSKDKYSIKSLPNIFPSFLMNSFIIKLLNFIYFLSSKSQKKKTSINNFFYPLDKVSKWNHLYGRKGFISYQCCVPLKNSYRSIFQILKILKENRAYSFVSVLKSMRNEKTLLSFGQKGFTLVFDFPIYKNIFKVLSQIDDVVLEYKGKIYLTKDSRIKQKNFYRINKEFKNKGFINFRKKMNYFFKSIQSERLGI